MLHIRAVWKSFQTTVAFTPNIPMFYWLSPDIFGNIVLKFCICYQLPPPNKSPNFETG